MVHAPAIIDVQTDVHIVPVDCDSVIRNLLILPTSCVVMAHGLGIYSLSGAPFLASISADRIASLVDSQSTALPL